MFQNIFKILLIIFFSLTAYSKNIIHNLPKNGLAFWDKLDHNSDFTHFKYANPLAPKGGTLTLAGIGSFDSLNPFIMKGTPALGLSYLFSSYLHVTLTKPSLDDGLSQYCYAAENFKLAPDKSYIEFNIRKEATFNDNDKTPILPEDIIFSFEILMSKGLPLYKMYYKDIKKIEKTGERRVKFWFKATNNRELPLIVGQMPLLSKKYFSSIDFQKTTLAIPLGSGPYRIAKVDPGKTIVYERVKNWWGENISVNKGMYNFDYIKFIYYKDKHAAFEGFKAGEFDLYYDYTARNWVHGYNFSAVKNNFVVKEEIPIKNTGSSLCFIFNIRKEIFKEPLVREALTIAFNFERINEKLFYNTYTRTTSYFGESELAASGLPSNKELNILNTLRENIPERVFNQEFKLPAYKNFLTDTRYYLTNALNLLKKAGWVISKNGTLINSKTKEPFSFQILLVDPKMEGVIQSFISSLKNYLGINATLRIITSSEYMQKTQNFNFDMILHPFPQSHSPGNEQYDYWGTKSADIKGSQNLIGIKNSAIDSIINLITKAQTREELITCTRILDRLLCWNFYSIPTWHSNSVRIAYYKNRIKHPSRMPLYQFNLDTWWSTETGTA